MREASWPAISGPPIKIHRVCRPGPAPSGHRWPTVFPTTEPGAIVSSHSSHVSLPFILTLLLAGCATNPPAATPAEDSLRLGNPRASFSVAVRAEGGPLRVGEPVHLNLRTATDGYLNLYFIDSSGNPGQLLTNYPVRANETVFFPPGSSKKLRYAPPEPAGAETFILVATHRPLNLFRGPDIKNRARPRTPFAEFSLSGPQFVNRLRGAMRQWPSQAWNADSIRLPLLPPLGRS